MNVVEARRWVASDRGASCKKAQVGSGVAESVFAKPGEPKTVSGPFEWAAIKSKYFVTAVLALDSTRGGISGATAVPIMVGTLPSGSD